MTWGLSVPGLAIVLSGQAHAQELVPATTTNTWQSYDWLKSAEDQQRQAASGEAFHATTGQDINDPFTVLSTGTLWQDKLGALYTRQLADTLSLSCETSSVTLGDGSEDLSRGQKMGFQFQPVQEFAFGGNVHESMVDSDLPGGSTSTSGAGFTAESHLPLSSTFTLGFNTDRTSTDSNAMGVTTTRAYDAQLQQPLGKLPLTAVFKGHYDETAAPGVPVSSLPSMEQSLVWKPLQDTTVQMGLRQQQYQEYPGVDNQFNQALFADWSQKMVGDITWHSYAEVLNSRGLIDQAPAAPLASGTNGTAQATTPGANVSPTSALPLSLDDQTLTFSTGPSFKLQKDISASVEYSDRWDKNPAAGSIGQEQRVSISVKGSF